MVSVSDMVRERWGDNFDLFVRRKWTFLTQKQALSFGCGSRQWCSPRQQNGWPSLDQQRLSCSNLASDNIESLCHAWHSLEEPVSEKTTESSHYTPKLIKFILISQVSFMNVLLGVTPCRSLPTLQRCRPNDGCSKHFWNICQLLSDYTALQTTRTPRCENVKPRLFLRILILSSRQRLDRFLFEVLTRKLCKGEWMKRTERNGET